MRQSSRLLICPQRTKDYGTATSSPVILMVIRSQLDGGHASDSFNLLNKGGVEREWLEVSFLDFQAAQNVRSSRPQPRKTPEAYSPGYVEDFFEVRTTLAGVFSSR